MTRGYVIYTENGKTASEVACLFSSAFPSYYGLELLNVIQGSLPLRSLMDCSDPEEMSEVYPLSTYDELVCVRAVDSKQIRDGWGVDYIYVYNTTTHTLSVRSRGTLLYKFDLATQMDACRAVFKYDSEIACINRRDLATCTEKTSHPAGGFPPSRRRRLPVQKREYIL